MNTKELAIREIEAFLVSDGKCMLLTGTHQYNKHKLIMGVLDKHYKKKLILFRTNSMQNVTNRDFLGFVGVNRPPKAGETIVIENNYYQIDNFNNRGTWHKSSSDIDFAIIYPTDALCHKQNYEAIEDLLQYKSPKKVFLVSWTDNEPYDNEFSKLYSEHVIYDAEEEDLHYHNRVLGLE
jgi:hypothetical protein